MTDIAADIRRLGQSYQQPHNYGDGDLMLKAAAEIERLRGALLKAQILLADHMPPEATFGNVEDMLRWLDDEQNARES